jgi:uncharacterized protein (TIGR02588 family)
MKMQKNWIEWSVFAGSAVVIAFCAVMLFVAMNEGGDGAPSLHLSAGAATQVATGFQVPLTIRNEGDSTAESVHVAVTLESKGLILEKAEIEFAFVPQDSERMGFVSFSRDPRCCNVVVRADGYTRP